MALSKTRHFSFLPLFPFFFFGLCLRCLFSRPLPTFEAFYVSPECFCRVMISAFKLKNISPLSCFDRAETNKRANKSAWQLHYMQHLSFFFSPLVFVFTARQCGVWSLSLRWPRADRTQRARTCGLAKIGSRHCVVAQPVDISARCSTLSQSVTFSLVVPALRPRISQPKTCLIRFIPPPGRNIASSTTGIVIAAWPFRNWTRLSSRRVVCPRRDSNRQLRYSKSDRNKGKGEDRKRLTALQQTAGCLFSALTPVRCTALHFHKPHLFDALVFCGLVPRRPFITGTHFWVCVFDWIPDFLNSKISSTFKSQNS